MNTVLPTCTLTYSPLRTLSIDLNASYFCNVLGVLPIMFSAKFGFNDHGEVAVVQLKRSNLVTVTLLNEVRTLTGELKVDQLKYIPQLNEFNTHMFVNNLMTLTLVWDSQHKDIDSWVKHEMVPTYDSRLFRGIFSASCDDSRHHEGRALDLEHIDEVHEDTIAYYDFKRAVDDDDEQEKRSVVSIKIEKSISRSRADSE